MGIRYYAYAYDEELTDQVASDPWAIVSSDPLADAWGFEPHAAVASPTFEQTSPARDMLYLDKAWRELQAVTSPTEVEPVPRPAWRMFDGRVTPGHDRWAPCIRALAPGEMPAIRDDLCAIDEDHVRKRMAGQSVTHDELRYVLGYLSRAQEFVGLLVAERRGMVYVIQ